MSDVKRREEDKALMQDPIRWPRWPWLPVKRYVEGPMQMETAVMFASGQPIVYKVALYELRANSTDLRNMPKYEYESFDKLLDDGWLVD